MLFKSPLLYLLSLGTIVLPIGSVIDYIEQQYDSDKVEQASNHFLQKENRCSINIVKFKQVQAL